MSDYGSNYSGKADDAWKKYDDFKTFQREQEKTRNDDKEKRKEEYLEDADNVLGTAMYIILTNERKLNKLRRSIIEFCEVYNELFFAYPVAEINRCRNRVLMELSDEKKCLQYADGFRRWSLNNRFVVATSFLFARGKEIEGIDYSDIESQAEWAIENSKEWFSPQEYSEVDERMKETLDDLRKDLDNQFLHLEKKMMDYSSAKEFLTISVSDGDGNEPAYSNFQLQVKGKLVSVKFVFDDACFSGVVMDVFPFYWGVSVREIWETAYANGFRDLSKGADDGHQLVERAIELVRLNYPN